MYGGISDMTIGNNDFSGRTEQPAVPLSRAVTDKAAPGGKPIVIVRQAMQARAGSVQKFAILRMLSTLSHFRLMLCGSVRQNWGMVLRGQ